MSFLVNPGYASEFAVQMIDMFDEIAMIKASMMIESGVVALGATGRGMYRGWKNEGYMYWYKLRGMIRGNQRSKDDLR